VDPVGPYYTDVFASEMGFLFGYKFEERNGGVFYDMIYLLTVGRVSSVGIATGYGLDGPGIESQWGRDFPHLSRPALGPTQPPVQWVPGLSRG
jgi:hypothetical protein